VGAHGAGRRTVHTTALGGSNTPFFNEADRQLAAYESEISLANG
jgi:hypothetical protein